MQEDRYLLRTLYIRNAFYPARFRLGLDRKKLSVDRPRFADQRKEETIANLVDVKFMTIAKHRNSPLSFLSIPKSCQVIFTERPPGESGCETRVELIETKSVELAAHRQVIRYKTLKKNRIFFLIANGFFDDSPGCFPDDARSLDAADNWNERKNSLEYSRQPMCRVRGIEFSCDRNFCQLTDHYIDPS